MSCEWKCKIVEKTQQYTKRRRVSCDCDDNEHKYELMPKAIDYRISYDGEYAILNMKVKTKDLEPLMQPSSMIPCHEYTEGEYVHRVFKRSEVESHRLQKQQQLQEEPSDNSKTFRESGYETFKDHPSLNSTPLRPSIKRCLENVCNYSHTISERKMEISELNKEISRLEKAHEFIGNRIYEAPKFIVSPQSSNPAVSTCKEIEDRPSGNVDKDNTVNVINIEEPTHIASKDYPEFTESRQPTDVNCPEENLQPEEEFTEAQLHFICDAMDKEKSGVLITKFNLSITRKQITCLQWDESESGFLNDQIINFYFNLLVERGNLKSYLKVHAMSTQFYTRLTSNVEPRGYEGVRKWTKNIDIFSCELIIVPIHIKLVESTPTEDQIDHWCIAIIYMKEKTIKYYDSLGNSNEKALQTLLDYLNNESLNKRNREIDRNVWKTEHVEDYPEQGNNFDCGVFICMTAEFVCRNRPITFNQEDMIYFRKKMVLEIGKGQLLQ